MARGAIREPVGGTRKVSRMPDASADRTGPFWDVLSGGRPAPPAAELLGWQLSWVAPERGEIEVFFRADRRFSNPMGTIQGGFLAAMLDDTLGSALVATLAEDEVAPTLELKVSFPRPASAGRLTGRGRVLHRSGTIAFLTDELRDDTGEVVATASATARVIRPMTTLPGAHGQPAWWGGLRAP